MIRSTIVTIAALFAVACTQPSPAADAVSATDSAVPAGDGASPDPHASAVGDATDGTAVASDSGTSRRELDVTSDDVTLHVWTVGGTVPGPTVLMLHGGPGASHDYLAAFERYAGPTVRFAFFDQRGSGRSTAPTTTGFAFEDYVRDLEAVRLALGAETLHLVGHSWGGQYAQAYVAAQRSRVASMVLINSAPHTRALQAQGDVLAYRRIAMLQRAGVIPNPLPRVTGDDCSARFAALWPFYNASPTFPAPPELQRTRCTQSALDETSRATGNFDFTAALASYTGPVAVIYGEADPFGIDGQTALAAACTSASSVRVTAVSAAGHFPWLEQPAAFDAAVRAFLQTQLGLALAGP